MKNAQPTHDNNQPKANGQQNLAQSADLKKEANQHSIEEEGTPQFSPQDMLAVQRNSNGLDVGSIEDPLEAEADKVADAVVNSPAPQANAQDPEKGDTETEKAAVAGKGSSSPQFSPPAGGDGNGGPAKHNVMNMIQRSATAGADGGGVSASSNVGQQITSARGKGNPLPDSTRSEMEGKFGTDLSNVRVHTDSRADQLNQDLQSNAFANQDDIHFAEGAYNPETREGKHLLAHEITHTIQQKQSNNVPSVQKNGYDRILKKIDVGPEEVVYVRIKSKDSDKFSYYRKHGADGEWMTLLKRQEEFDIKAAQLNPIETTIKDHEVKIARLSVPNAEEVISKFDPVDQPQIRKLSLEPKLWLLFFANRAFEGRLTYDTLKDDGLGGYTYSERPSTRSRFQLGIRLELKKNRDDEFEMTWIQFYNFDSAGATINLGSRRKASGLFKGWETTEKKITDKEKEQKEAKEEKERLEQEKDKEKEENKQGQEGGAPEEEKKQGDDDKEEEKEEKKETTDDKDKDNNTGGNTPGVRKLDHYLEWTENKYRMEFYDLGFRFSNSDELGTNIDETVTGLDPSQSYLVLVRGVSVKDKVTIYVDGVRVDGDSRFRSGRRILTIPKGSTNVRIVAEAKPGSVVDAEVTYNALKRIEKVKTMRQKVYSDGTTDPPQKVRGSKKELPPVQVPFSKHKWMANPQPYWKIKGEKRVVPL